MAIGTLLRVARNVTDLARICAFYVEALGFSVSTPPTADPELAEVLGVASVTIARLRLGEQILELTECQIPGRPYPRYARSDDIRFQHIAIVTTDICSAQARAVAHGATAISSDGPVLLPASSGGVWAWKFRDPDGHPLELLQFPAGSGWDGAALHLGYDHCAIVVADTRRSIDFYTALQLELRHRHVNHGMEQDRLDGLFPSVVEVVALAGPDAPPHVELLGYASPSPAAEVKPSDIGADRLVFGTTPGSLKLTQDPDGHFLLLDARQK